MNKMILAAAAGLAAIAAAPASAALKFELFRVTPNGQDFGPASHVNSVITNGVESRLGPNGMPVVTTANPLGAVNINSARELMWWTPGNTSNLSVTSEGEGWALGNSYTDTTFFSPFGNGTDNVSAFLTAIVSGTFVLDAARNVDFTIGADDDAFLFINGISQAQIGGIHALTSQTFSVALGAGEHTFQMFYADRLQSNAQISFALPDDLEVNAPVPEPATWAMMLVGFGMIGATARYRRRATKATFA